MKQQYLFDRFSQQALQTCIATVLLCSAPPSVICKLQFEILFFIFHNLHRTNSYGQTISTDPH